MKPPVTTESAGTTRPAVVRRADGRRTMMVRAGLHGVSTVAGLAGMQTMHDAPMGVRMMLYALSWIACAVAYVPMLYLREYIVDAWDDRTRRIVREEFDRFELRAYKEIVEHERDRRHAGNSEEDAAR